MKLLLLIGGIAFLLLGVLLCLAAVVVFLMARKRAGKQAGASAQRPVAKPAPPTTRSDPPPAAPPAAEVPQAVPPAPPPAVPFPSPAFEDASHASGEATLALPLSGREQWGMLHAMTGPLAGRSFPITAEGFYIGRDSSVSQVVIEDGSVSKRHVWVGVRDGAVMAIDEGSTNGTYVNAVTTRINRQPLNIGDTLIISNDIARLVYQR